MAIEKRFKIIQLDEFVITKNTMLKNTWSLPKMNTEISISDSYIQNKAVLIAISRESGVEHIEVYNYSINKARFKVFLQSIRDKNMFDDVILVMDNINFHKSYDSKERMDELGFLYSYTPVYSPKFNGVEEVINIGK